MIVSIASGKGGTGKTTVATNLANVVEENVMLLDCDVEEPNAHIFLKPEFESSKKINVPVPEIDLDRCTFCGKCAEICMYKAILVLKDNVLIFNDLCHSCGGCKLICPENAVTEVPKPIGIVENGKANGINFVRGKLDIGNVLVPKLIKEVKTYIDKSKLVIIDAPPGTSCPVIEAVRNTDFCILVTEPTPFGLFDLKLAVGVIRKLGIPFGIILNRANTGFKDLEKYCEKESIKILMKIPNERKIAEAYSKGFLITDIFDEYRESFKELADRIIEGNV